MPFIAGSGRTPLFYADWGHGRPVVLLHGWALNHQMWESQVAFLIGHGLRCIAYDRRGHGRSDAPGTGYDYDTLADDLDAVLGALDLSDVLLVAHSMAAGEAVRHLARGGAGADRVSALVLVGGTTPCLAASPGNPGGIPVELLEASAAQLAADRPGWFRAGTPAYFARPESAPLDPQMRAGLDMCLQTPLPVLQACTATMIGADLRADVARVAVPTLVVHGDADVSAPFPLTAQPTTDLLRDGRLLVYPGAPHGLYVTEQDRFNKDLLAFATAGAPGS